VGLGFLVQIRFALRSLAVWRVRAIAPSFIFGWRAFSSVSLCKSIPLQPLRSCVDIVAMSDPYIEIDVTDAQQPAHKLPEKLTGIFREFDSKDPGQVAAKAQRKRNERIWREKETRRKAERLLHATDKHMKAEAVCKADTRKRKKDELEAAKALVQDDIVQLEQSASAAAGAQADQNATPVQPPKKKQDRSVGSQNRMLTLYGKPKRAVMDEADKKNKDHFILRPDAIQALQLLCIERSTRKQSFCVSTAGAFLNQARENRELCALCAPIPHAAGSCLLAPATQPSTRKPSPCSPRG
jgi:hypothetical protein